MKALTVGRLRAFLAHLPAGMEVHVWHRENEDAWGTCPAGAVASVRSGENRVTIHPLTDDNPAGDDVLGVEVFESDGTTFDYTRLESTDVLEDLMARPPEIPATLMEDLIARDSSASPPLRSVRGVIMEEARAKPTLTVDVAVIELVSSGKSIVVTHRAEYGDGDAVESCEEEAEAFARMLLPGEKLFVRHLAVELPMMREVSVSEVVPTAQPDTENN